MVQTLRAGKMRACSSRISDTYITAPRKRQGFILQKGVKCKLVRLTCDFFFNGNHNQCFVVVY